jgi:hypothetical protein
MPLSCSGGKRRLAVQRAQARLSACFKEDFSNLGVAGPTGKEQGSDLACDRGSVGLALRGERSVWVHPAPKEITNAIYITVSGFVHEGRFKFTASGILLCFAHVR